MSEKIDFKVLHQDLYRCRAGIFEEVDVPALRYVALDGQGDPATSAQYAAAIEALYGVSYTLKFTSKTRGRDYVVAPLEGLWWAEDMAAFVEGRRESWRWTMMILLPEWITVQDVEHAKESVAEKKPGLDLGAVHVLDLDEGHSVQFLFIGPYLEEAPVIEELHHVYLPAHGLTPRGRHHEIYLSDPRRTAPATLRTILRQPVE